MALSEEDLAFLKKIGQITDTPKVEPKKAEDK